MNPVVRTELPTPASPPAFEARCQAGVDNSAFSHIRTGSTYLARKSVQTTEATSVRTCTAPSPRQQNSGTGYMDATFPLEGQA